MGVITYNADTDGVARFVYTIPNTDGTVDGNPSPRLSPCRRRVNVNTEYPMDLTRYVFDEGYDTLKLAQVVTWDTTTVGAWRLLFRRCRVYTMRLTWSVWWCCREITTYCWLKIKLKGECVALPRLT